MNLITASRATTLLITVQFMHTLSGLYQDEDEREGAPEPFFNQLFGETATPDRDIFVQRETTPPTMAVVMIAVHKRGLGESGDASVRVCFSMMKFWLNDEV